jgi:hypothetical protein
MIDDQDEQPDGNIRSQGTMDNGEMGSNMAWVGSGTRRRLEMNLASADSADYSSDYSRDYSHLFTI